MKYRVERNGQVHEIDVELNADGLVVRGADGIPQRFRFEQRDDGALRAITPWGELSIDARQRGAELWVRAGRERLVARVERARPSRVRGGGGSDAGTVVAPMAGKLLRLDARVGDVFKAGQALAVIEAMKMENELVAPIDGVVAEVAAAAPGTVEKGALIVRLEPR
jgi:biotin carboxyl carrier protein